MDPKAQKIFDEVALPSSGAATNSEILKGRWILPEGSRNCIVHERLSKFLFKEYPEWGVIVVLNSQHIHRNGTDIITKGVYWVHECNPTHIPRVWYAVAPLLFSKDEKTGILYFDKKNGEYLPDIGNDTLLTALRFKDMFNTTVKENTQDVIKDINKHNEGVEQYNNTRADKVGEEFLKEIEADNKIKSTDQPPSKQPLLVDPQGNPVTSNV